MDDYISFRVKFLQNKLFKLKNQKKKKVIKELGLSFELLNDGRNCNLRF